MSKKTFNDVLHSNQISIKDKVELTSDTKKLTLAVGYCKITKSYNLFEDIGDEVKYCGGHQEYNIVHNMLKQRMEKFYE